MKSVLMILAEGYEELEFVAPFDIFQRGGLQITIASLTESLTVISAHGLSIQAHTTLALVHNHHFDLIFLPGGGPGTQRLRQSEAVRNLVIHQHQQGRALAAICAAPLVLGDAGLLQGRRATCFPSVQEELSRLGATVVQDRVVQDGFIFCSRGAGSAAEFGFALLTYLENAEKTQSIRSQMQFS